MTRRARIRRLIVKIIDSIIYALAIIAAIFAVGVISGLMCMLAGVA